MSARRRCGSARAAPSSRERSRARSPRRSSGRLRGRAHDHQDVGRPEHDGAFGSIGPQGVFVREIEQALVERRIELAVHSFKDLPTKSPAELTIAAVPERVDAADLLLVRRDALAGSDGDWLPLKTGARVGTASARRRVWLAHFRPDLRIEPLRGNVPTRIRRLEEGGFDAIVLAAAGVERLHAEQRLGAGIAVLRLDPQRFVPAPAQGALAVQCRRDDCACSRRSRSIDHAPSRAAVTAERDALARAEGGCDVAFGAYCTAAGSHYELIAMHERAGVVRTARVAGADPATLGAAAGRSSTRRRDHDAPSEERRRALASCSRAARKIAPSGPRASRSTAPKRLRCRAFAASRSRRLRLRAALAAAVPQAPIGSCSRRAAASRRSRRSRPRRRARMPRRRRRRGDGRGRAELRSAASTSSAAAARPRRSPPRSSATAS